MSKTEKIVLSERLQAVATMVTPGHIVADVGCDHGFVSIYLIQNKIAPKVYAMDVRQGPLARAKEHVAQWGLEGYIETRLSDGLLALLPGEANAMICAGMGGKLMQKILTEGKKQREQMTELILQPQSELSAFRCFLRAEGYVIIEEKMIFEDGKFYPMMRVQQGVQVMAEDPDTQRIWDKFGRLLLQEKNPVLQKFLCHNIKVSKEILKNLRETECGDTARKAREERIKGILTEIRDMETALSQMTEADREECK